MALSTEQSLTRVGLAMVPRMTVAAAGSACSGPARQDASPTHASNCTMSGPGLTACHVSSRVVHRFACCVSCVVQVCVLTQKFRNLHIYGCWWYCNNPSMIDEITRMRIEMLGTAFTAQHSDARILDQLIYKWAHSRKAIAPVCAGPPRPRLPVLVSSRPVSIQSDEGAGAGFATGCLGRHPARAVSTRRRNSPCLGCHPPPPQSQGLI